MSQASRWVLLPMSTTSSPSETDTVSDRTDGRAGGPAVDLAVDLAVFDELRGTYSDAVAVVASTRNVLAEAGVPQTGSTQLDSLIRLMVNDAGRFLGATATNLTLDRDALASSRVNYDDNERGITRTAGSVLGRLIAGLPAALLAPVAVSGPAERIATPTGPPR
jgi:hypothetical protein